MADLLSERFIRFSDGIRKKANRLERERSISTLGAGVKKSLALRFSRWIVPKN